MKNLLSVLVLMLATASLSHAQDNNVFSNQAAGNKAANLSSSSQTTFGLPESSYRSFAQPRFADSWLAAPFSEPAPPESLPAAPAPKYVYGSRDD